MRFFKRFAQGELNLTRTVREEASAP